MYRGELLRHPVYTRVLHWMVALFFFLALFTGFGIYLPWLFRWFTPFFGGGPLSRADASLVRPGLRLFLRTSGAELARADAWTAADTKWMRNVHKIAGGKKKWIRPRPAFSMPGRKFSSGRSSAAASSTSSQASFCGRGRGISGGTAVAVSYVLHDISALIMLGGIFIHIYQSTIGEPGTFQAMIRGAVSEAWAWTFHPAWYKQVTGRDPRQAYEKARQQPSGTAPKQS